MYTMVSEVTTSTKFTVGVRYLLAGVLVASFIALVASVVALNIVPSFYLWLGVGVYAAVTGLLVWALLTKKRWANRHMVWIGLVAASLMLSAVNVYATSSARAINTLVSSVQTKESSYVEYAIIARKDRDISLDSAQSIATLSSDPLHNKLLAALAHETPAAQQSATTLADIKNSLQNSSVQLAAVRKATLPIIEEADSAFYASLAVLHTIRVAGEGTANVQQIDITKPYVVYISGIDTSGKISSISRSDVNMLMVINPVTHAILLVNTPRDYYVQLHGTTGLRDKLTHAGVYGVNTSIRTLEDLYGVDISHYVRINFTSLVTLIDTLGPIEVYSDHNFSSYRKGYNTLNSKQALEFARERYSFSEGDRQRGRNQQHVIEAIIAKLSRTENAVRLPQITQALRGAIETDMPEASLKAIIRQQLDDIRPWKVESIAVDGVGAMQPTYSYGSSNLYVMIPSDESVAAAKQKMRSYLGTK